MYDLDIKELIVYSYIKIGQDHWHPQQHLPFFSFFTSPFPKAKLWLLSGICFSSYSLIILAKHMKLSSILTLFLTEVDKYLILWAEHHSLTSASLTLLSRSLLLPMSIMTALSALVLHRSYHCSLMFLNDFSDERSNTMSTPLHPLKQVDTIDLYFSCPAVSQMYNLTGLSFKLMFLILKSIVVTWVSFSAKKSPQVKRQNKAVLPTLLSPMMIILYLFSSLFVERQRSSIITFGSIYLQT